MILDTLTDRLEREYKAALARDKAQALAREKTQALRQAELDERRPVAPAPPPAPGTITPVSPSAPPVTQRFPTPPEPPLLYSQRSFEKATVFRNPAVRRLLFGTNDAPSMVSNVAPSPRSFGFNSHDEAMEAANPAPFSGIGKDAYDRARQYSAAYWAWQADQDPAVSAGPRDVDAVVGSTLASLADPVTGKLPGPLEQIAQGFLGEALRPSSLVAMLMPLVRAGTLPKTIFANAALQGGANVTQDVALGRTSPGELGLSAGAGALLGGLLPEAGRAARFAKPAVPAAAGAGIGAALGDTPEERLKYAALGATAGLGLQATARYAGDGPSGRFGVGAAEGSLGRPRVLADVGEYVRHSLRFVNELGDGQADALAPDVTKAVKAVAKGNEDVLIEGFDGPGGIPLTAGQVVDEFNMRELVGYEQARLASGERGSLGISSNLPPSRPVGQNKDWLIPTDRPFTERGPDTPLSVGWVKLEYKVGGYNVNFAHALRELYTYPDPDAPARIVVGFDRVAQGVGKPSEIKEVGRLLYDMQRLNPDATIYALPASPRLQAAYERMGFEQEHGRPGLLNFNPRKFEADVRVRLGERGALGKSRPGGKAGERKSVKGRGIQGEYYGIEKFGPAPDDPFPTFAPAERFGYPPAVLAEKTKEGATRALSAMRSQMKADTLAGVAARPWYKHGSKAIARMFGFEIDPFAPNADDLARAAISQSPERARELDQFMQAVAITSPKRTPAQNMDHALRAWFEWKTTGLVRGGEGSGISDSMAKKLQSVFEGTDWEGRKTDAFYMSHIRWIDPDKWAAYFSETGGAPVADRWILRSGGYASAAEEEVSTAKAPRKAEADTVTSRQFKVLGDEIHRIAAELGWDFDEVQAAMWAGVKERLGTNAKERDASNYADALRDASLHISSESVPSTTITIDGTTPLLEGIENLPQEAQLAFHREVQAVFINPDGTHKVFEFFGLPVYAAVDSPVLVDGTITPMGVQHLVPVAQDLGGGAARLVDEEAVPKADAAATLIAYATGQKTVGTTRHFILPQSSPSGVGKAAFVKMHNAAVVRLGRALEESEFGKLVSALQREYPDNHYVIPKEDGFAVQVFNPPDGHTIEGFQSTLDRVFEDALPDTDRIANIVGYSGKLLPENDWRISPNGEDHLAALGKLDTGRVGPVPGRLELARSLRASVEAIWARWAGEYNLPYAAPEVRAAAVKAGRGAKGRVAGLLGDETGSLGRRGVRAGERGSLGLGDDEAELRELIRVENESGGNIRIQATPGNPEGPFFVHGSLAGGGKFASRGTLRDAINGLHGRGFETASPVIGQMLGEAGEVTDIRGAAPRAATFPGQNQVVQGISERRGPKPPSVGGEDLIGKRLDARQKQRIEVFEEKALELGAPRNIARALAQAYRDGDFFAQTAKRFTDSPQVIRMYAKANAWMQGNVPDGVINAIARSRMVLEGAVRMHIDDNLQVYKGIDDLIEEARPGATYVGPENMRALAGEYFGHSVVTHPEWWALRNADHLKAMLDHLQRFQRNLYSVVEAIDPNAAPALDAPYLRTVWKVPESDLESTVSMPIGRASVTKKRAFPDPFEAMASEMWPHKLDPELTVAQLVESSSRLSARQIGTQLERRMVLEKFGQTHKGPNVKGFRNPNYAGWYGPPEVVNFVDLLHEPGVSVAQQIGKVTDPIRNTMFGVADIGVFGQHMMQLTMTKGPLVLGAAINRALSRIGLGMDVYRYPAAELPHSYQRALDGLVSSSSAGRISDEAGQTLFQYVPGIGKPIERYVDTLNRIQFGLVLAPIRDMAYEGNLIVSKLLGRDMNSPAVRRAAADNANAFSGSSLGAFRRGRREAERALLGAPSITRAMFAQLAQVAKINSPEAITTLASFGAMVYGLGSALNMYVGSGEPVPFDPRKVDWATVKLGGKWKNIEGRRQYVGGYTIRLIPQASLVRAIGKSYEALAEGNPDRFARAWQQFAFTRTTPALQSAVGALGGAGFDSSGRFHWGDLSFEDRLKNLAPIPIAGQAAVEGDVKLNKPGGAIMTIAGVSMWPGQTDEQALRKSQRERKEEFGDAPGAQLYKRVDSTVFTGLQKRGLIPREYSSYSEFRTALTNEFRKRLVERGLEPELAPMLVDNVPAVRQYQDLTEALRKRLLEDPRIRADVIRSGQKPVGKSDIPLLAGQ